MDTSAWPFEQPKNCAVISLRKIIFDGDPILYVSHDADDHGWQFLGLEAVEPKNAVVVSLEEVVRIDESILEVADLPVGWCAWRESKTAPWRRSEPELGR